MFGSEIPQSVLVHLFQSVVVQSIVQRASWGDKESTRLPPLLCCWICDDGFQVVLVVSNLEVLVAVEVGHS